MTEIRQVVNPLVIIHETGDKTLITNIHSIEGINYKHYGIIVCDLVRHVARAFKVDEDDVWEWVDKERRHNTTDIQLPS